MLVFDIRRYGAVGDGRTLNTAAINRAVEACAAAGGGQVLFPPGSYLSGTVQLRSNVTLQLEAGARLVGIPALSQYQAFSPPPAAAEARYGKWHRALVLGDGVENVRIQGGGVIDGNRVMDPQGEEHMRGPHAILFGRSRNIQIQDISVVDSANYAILLQWSEQVEVRDVRMTGGWDGVHFRASAGQPCRDIRLAGCQFRTGDDAIAGRYVQNLQIERCTLNSACNGVRIIGPVQRMTLSDCRFYGPGEHPQRRSKRRNMLCGILLQPGAWDPCPGALEDVEIRDVEMQNVAAPVAIWLKRPGNTADRISVHRLTAGGVYHAAMSVESWARRPIGDVRFHDLDIRYHGGRPGRNQPAATRPAVDVRPLPAWAFYARHVQRLQLDHVRLSSLQEDPRSVLLCEGVERLTMHDVSYPEVPGAASPLVLENTNLVPAERP